MSGTIYNILGVYRLADHVDLVEGDRAYQSYNSTMALFGLKYDVPTSLVAGVFAALSPVNGLYKGNLRSMKTVLLAARQGMLDAPDHIVVTTTGPNKRKALRIAAGEDPMAVLSGDKVRNFFVNICEPTNSHAVTIDRHAQSVWMGERALDGRVPHYDRVADAYREAAYRIGVLPSQLQATTWFTWKRLNRIVYDGQLDLFRVSNQWQSVIRPDEVEEFPWRK